MVKQHLLKTGVGPVIHFDGDVMLANRQLNLLEDACALIDVIVGGGIGFVEDKLVIHFQRNANWLSKIRLERGERRYVVNGISAVVSHLNRYGGLLIHEEFCRPITQPNLKCCDNCHHAKQGNNKTQM